MKKIAIVYWSGTGNTAAMAEAVLAGAAAAGAEASLLDAAAFSASDVPSYDALAFGCPAMDAEVLEELEFEPMFNDVRGSLGTRPVGLFGSYGWGGGAWMDAWAEDCSAAGITLAAAPVICMEAPDDDALAACRALGAALA